MPSEPRVSAAAPSTPAAARADTLLDVRDLRVSFGEIRNSAVDGVSFSMRRGETFCLVGESGSGKSVTALALMGLLQRGSRIEAERMMLDDIELTTLTPAELRGLRGRRMGMIFQEPMTSLNPSLTVGEQVSEALTRDQDLGRAELRDRLTDLFAQVRIPSPDTRIDQYPHQLSGGMRQRVMIAMAMAGSPDLLIADEPTTALDVTIQAQILDLMRRLREETGTAILMITHDLGVVAEVGDRVGVMYAGRIVETGPVRQIFEAPLHPYTVGLLAAIPRLDDAREYLATIDGTVPSLAEMPQGCRFHPRCHFATERCRAERPAMTEAGPDHAVACWHPMSEHDAQACEAPR